MTDTFMYFGRPGSLARIVIPKDGLEATRQISRSTFQLGNGGTRVSRLLHGKRVYTLKYQNLTLADWATLHAYEQGLQGPGPFALLDPGQRNMLTANQAAATALTNDTDNFTPAGSGGVIDSSATLVHGTLPRALRWSFNVSTPATATLTLDPPTTDFPGVPVVDRPLCFSCWARTAAGTITVTPQLLWTNLLGASTGTSSGAPVVVGAGAWSQLVVTASPPSVPPATAYVNSSLAASGASITAGELLYVSDLMLNEGTTPDALWVPGTGVPAVAPMSLADAWPAYFTPYREAPEFVLQEVGGT